MKNFAFFAVFFLFAGWAAAQETDNNSPRERMKAHKRTFISEAIALSAQDSAKFWPVYDAYEKERMDNRRAQMRLTRGMLAKDDNALRTDVEAMVSLKEEEGKIARRYLTEFQKVISIRQIAALYQAEQGFKRSLVDHMGGGRHGRGGGDYERGKGSRGGKN